MERKRETDSLTQKSSHSGSGDASQFVTSGDDAAGEPEPSALDTDAGSAPRPTSSTPGGGDVEEFKPN